MLLKDNFYKLKICPPIYIFIIDINILGYLSLFLSDKVLFLHFEHLRHRQTSIAHLVLETLPAKTWYIG